MSSAERYTEIVDRSVLPHRWIFCADAAAGFTAGLRELVAKGMPRPLLLAGTTGTGDLLTPDEAELVILDLPADTMMGGIRAFHAALRHLPEWAIDRIDAWDPDRTARIMPSFLDTAIEIGGRPSWGARDDAWVALEDKTTVEAIWEAAGVDHAPSLVVPARGGDLVAAARRLGGTAGSVWAGDNREGWHGGAEYTRFVADPDEADDTIAFMEAHADRVRVMPFLEGVPCSIHGMVFLDAVAAFRPVEMVVFRVPGSDRFRYASVATSWDPPPAMRDEMRAAARRVGAHLRTIAGFRGVFTMDGVATADGWLPTEINTRYGAGLAPVSRAANMPLLGINRLLIAGQPDGLDPEEIERISVDAADAVRSLGGFVLVPERITASEEQRVAWDGMRMTLVAEGEGNATVTRGPAAAGGMVRFALDPAAVVPGTQAAPVVADAFNAIDDLWGTGIGPLIPGRLESAQQ